jgi:hypothetical protein
MVKPGRYEGVHGVRNGTKQREGTVPHRFIPVLPDTFLEKIYMVGLAMVSDVRQKYLALTGDTEYLAGSPDNPSRASVPPAKTENPLAKGGLIEFLIFWNLGAVSIVLLYCLLAWMYRRWSQMKHFEQIPGPMVRSWTGNILDLRDAPKVRGKRDIFSLIQGYSKQHFGSGLFRLWHYHPWLPTSQCLLFVHDTNLVRQIMMAEKTREVDKTFVRETLGPLAGRGLFASQDKHQWQCMRS